MKFSCWNKVRSFACYFPIHTLLLPIYFILNRYVHLAGLFDPKDFIGPFLKVSAASLIFLIICKFILRSFIKSAIFTTIFSIIYLFFGNIRESFFTFPLLRYIAPYRIFLPITFLAIIIIFFYLNKTRKTEKITAFLNILLLLYTSIEIIKWDLLVRGQKIPSTEQINFAQNGKPSVYPDIYYIVLDGYPSTLFQKEKTGILVNQLDIDLKQNGFHLLSNSRSNYNYTAFSSESVIKMNYLEGVHNYAMPEPEHYSNTVIGIKSAQIFKLLEKKGYEIFNYSIFDLPRRPSISKEKLFFVTTPGIIFRHTLWNRIKWEVLPAIFPSFVKILESSQRTDFRKNKNKLKQFNQVVFDSLSQIIATENIKPKFVYAHLEMPHSPYIFDSAGKEFPDSMLLSTNNLTKRNMFKSYISYVNKKTTVLTNSILNGTNHQAIIIIQSDHGCRDSEITTNKDDAFRNYSAFYFPDRDYSMLYDSMSNINTFRVVLNKYFGQKLPLLKDSSIYLFF